MAAPDVIPENGMIFPDLAQRNHRVGEICNQSVEPADPHRCLRINRQRKPMQLSNFIVTAHKREMAQWNSTMVEGHEPGRKDAR